MTVTAQVHVVDVGTVELNDLILSSSYRDLVETQNAVYRDSHSVLLSFVEASVPGWVVKAGSVVALVTTVVPEGIDQLRVTSRGKNVELEFLDITNSAVMATHNHTGLENTLTTLYTLPNTGTLLLTVSVSVAGFVRQMLVEWESTTLP